MLRRMNKTLLGGLAMLAVLTVAAVMYGWWATA